jgi:FKBP-type peptidyl-prolyl cis-trans isomerase (trigger factor)
MTSSLKKLKDLERSLTVSIEKDLYKSKFDEKISNLKKNVKLDGFRKGKVQMMLLNKDMEDLFTQRS